MIATRRESPQQAVSFLQARIRAWEGAQPGSRVGEGVGMCWRAGFGGWEVAAHPSKEKLEMLYSAQRCQGRNRHTDAGFGTF